jgi:prepilin-type N-terminal cleavage/methylation domain-containing protein
VLIPRLATKGASSQRHLKLEKRAGDICPGGWRIPMPNRSVHSDQGFSIVELLVVVAIIMVLTAVAVPTVTTAVASARMRGAMGDISGLFQNARGLAVRQNTLAHVRSQLINNRWQFYVDTLTSNGWTGLTTSAPQVWLPPHLTKVGPPSGGTPTALDAAKCGSSSTPDTTDDTYFNQLGSPCLYNSGACSTSQAFVYYFNYAGASGPSWTAMCVSPAGRMKAWYWNGSGWSN